MKIRKMRKQPNGVLRVIEGTTVKDLVLSRSKAGGTRLARTRTKGIPVQVDGVWYYEYPEPLPAAEVKLSALETLTGQIRKLWASLMADLMDLGKVS